MHLAVHICYYTFQDKIVLKIESSGASGKLFLHVHGAALSFH